ncbi:hypothetical protein SAMN02746041_02809 [Desulfacinum hydrothermale DSM 13146]|uniref:Uncharacterized protein n=1 Tax=Desulfacinum hydrothermale DSM 13146 TaxID=1121390 RepID=A0A1W1XSU1_9BACT|nr:hypothetical protein [Desulfacinum hydrothermale]SMC26912.1 hypothetical protein SAMN02746041_02809 [Desulfacinum hydrothermale DSM 13146]
MPSWIPFAEGSYIIERAYLVTPLERAVELTEGLLEVTRDALDDRVMQGRAYVQNSHMVRLLEDEETFDLVMDLGEGFRYRLVAPHLQAGKVFEPTTRSLVHFSPTGPLQSLSDPDYDRLCRRLQLATTP